MHCVMIYTIYTTQENYKVQYSATLSLPLPAHKFIEARSMSFSCKTITSTMYDVPVVASAI